MTFCVISSYWYHTGHLVISHWPLVIKLSARCYHVGVSKSGTQIHQGQSGQSDSDTWQVLITVFCHLRSEWHQEQAHLCNKAYWWHFQIYYHCIVTIKKLLTSEYLIQRPLNTVWSLILWDLHLYISITTTLDLTDNTTIANDTPRPLEYHFDGLMCTILIKINYHKILSRIHYYFNVFFFN